MAKIILQDFSPKDFDKLVDEFLFSDGRVTIPAEALPPMREHLVKWGTPFQEMIQAYFERTDNVRYDNLTKRMENFAAKLQNHSVYLRGEEKKSFLLFWNEIADILRMDYMQLQDQYLENSCNYFIHEINKLS
jgi:hypothetical protein